LSTATQTSTPQPNAIPRQGAGTKVLSDSELARYQRDGFLIPDFRLSEAEVGRLRALIDKLVQDNPAKAADGRGMHSPHVPGTGGIKSGPGWMEFGRHPLILDMIEQIIGPDIILRDTNCWYKPARTGPATAWHRDAVAKWITPPETTAVWIAATECRKENGCLRFIPGTHTSRECGTHTHDPVRGYALNDGEYDESKAVDIEIGPGQMVIFDFFVIHGSRPNLGTRERAAYKLGFLPGNCKINHEMAFPEHLQTTRVLSPAQRPIILVRGQDRAGNDFEHGHSDPAAMN
jgi:hypothetical protein